MTASCVSLLTMHIFVCIPIETQAFPEVRVGKFWPVRQIWPTIYFGATHELRMVLTDEYL